MGLSNGLSCETGSCSCCCNLHRFYFLTLGLCRSPVISPSLFTHKSGTSQSTSHCSTCPSLRAAALPQVLSAHLPVSTPATSPHECFFFNSLFVRLPCSLVFWQFWLFFIFKLVVILLLVVRGSKAYLPTPPSCLELPCSIIFLS